MIRTSDISEWRVKNGNEWSGLSSQANDRGRFETETLRSPSVVLQRAAVSRFRHQETVRDPVREPTVNSLSPRNRPLPTSSEQKSCLRCRRNALISTETERDRSAPQFPSYANLAGNRAPTSCTGGFLDSNAKALPDRRGLLTRQRVHHFSNIIFLTSTNRLPGSSVETASIR